MRLKTVLSLTNTEKYCLGGEQFGFGGEAQAHQEAKPLGRICSYTCELKIFDFVKFFGKISWTPNQKHVYIV